MIGDGLMKDVRKGKMMDKRGPGRKRRGMIDDLPEKEQNGDLKRRAEDEQIWSLAVRYLPGGKNEEPEGPGRKRKAQRH